MEVNRPFFDGLLKDRRLSLRELARRMEMLPSQLSLTFKGVRRMQITEAVKISQILGAPVAEVMVAAGIEEAKMARARATIVGIYTAEGHVIPNPSVERIVLPDGLPDECEAIQARTDGTAMAWIDGFITIAAPLSADGIEALIGRYARVKIKDGPEVIATIRRGYEPNTYNLAGPVGTLTNQVVEMAAPIYLTKH